MRKIIQSTNTFRVGGILVVLLLTSACRPYHRTSLEALTEFPGYLEKADAFTMSSVQVLQQQKTADGLVLLYRWQTSESVKNKTFCLATTFVTSEGNGWRAQSSGSVGRSDSGQCSIPETHGFVAAYTVGGNITDLTTAYGISDRGNAVRIEWSDGLVVTAPLQSSAFLAIRPAILQVRLIGLLDSNGNILETWNGDSH